MAAINFIYSNFFNTTLASPIASTIATTMTISSTTNAPVITAGQIWVVVLNDAATQSVFEIVYVTARTGATCTILRGQEGTAAATWLTNDLAYAPDTAAILNNFAQANVAGAIAIDTSSTGQTKAGALTFAGLVTVGAGIEDSGATPSFTFLHGNVPLFGVPSSNTANLNTIAFGQAAGTTTIGAGTANFSACNGVSATTFAMGSGALNTLTMDSNGAIGLGVIAAGHGTTNTLYATVGVTGSAYLAGSTNIATKALDFGNGLGAARFSRVGSMGDAAGSSGVSGTAFEIWEATAGALLAVNNLGTVGIAGTSYNISSSRSYKKNIQALNFDPITALRGFKAQSWHVNQQEDDEPLQFGPIAEDLPTPIRAGDAGYNSTAAVSLALECLRIVEERVVALEGKGPAAAR